MRPLLALCLSIAAVVSVAAEDVIDRHEREFKIAVEQADAERDAKIRFARDRFISKLKDVMAEYTKAGALDAALKAKQKMADYSGAAGVAMIKPQSPTGLRLLVSFESAKQTDGQLEITDASGNDFILRGQGVRLGQGRVGAGLILDADHNVQTTANIGISGNQPRTYSFWLVLSKAHHPCYIGMATESHNASFRIDVAKKGNWMLWACGLNMDWHSPAYADVGKWHHHCVVFDGKKVNWYIDGDPVGNGFEHRYDTANAPFQIGPLSGIVDELAIFDHALTPEEITSLRKLALNNTSIDTLQPKR